MYKPIPTDTNGVPVGPGSKVRIVSDKMQKYGITKYDARSGELTFSDPTATFWEVYLAEMNKDNSRFIIASRHDFELVMPEPPPVAKYLDADGVPVEIGDNVRIRLSSLHPFGVHRDERNGFIATFTIEGLAIIKLPDEHGRGLLMVPSDAFRKGHAE